MNTTTPPTNNLVTRCMRERLAVSCDVFACKVCVSESGSKTAIGYEKPQKCINVPNKGSDQDLSVARYISLPWGGLHEIDTHDL
jgi:hypothetical protein